MESGLLRQLSVMPGACPGHDENKRLILYRRVELSSGRALRGPGGAPHHDEFGSALERFGRNAAGARDQLLVGFGQRLAVVAKTVGNGIAAVAAKVLFRHLDAWC